MMPITTDCEADDGASMTGRLRGTTASALAWWSRHASTASAAWRPGRYQGERPLATEHDTGELKGQPAGQHGQPY